VLLLEIKAKEAHLSKDQGEERAEDQDMLYH